MSSILEQVNTLLRIKQTEKEQNLVQERLLQTGSGSMKGAGGRYLPALHSIQCLTEKLK